MIRRSIRIIAGAAAAVSALIALAALRAQPALALDPARPIEQYVHDGWPRDQALPHNTIHSLLQTADGYIWLATEEGVARFDGVRFKVFDVRNTPQIASNQIQFLFEDSRRALWIGTIAGLTLYENGEFTAYNSSTGLSDPRVSSICEDDQGAVWIGTAAGLNRFKDGRFIVYGSRDGLPSDTIRAVRADKTGALWAGTAAGLARFYNGEWKTF